MSEAAQDPTATEQSHVDTPMDSSEAGKGKGKMAAEQDPMEEDDDSSEEDEVSSPTSSH